MAILFNKRVKSEINSAWTESFLQAWDPFNAFESKSRRSSSRRPNILGIVSSKLSGDQSRWECRKCVLRSHNLPIICLKSEDLRLPRKLWLSTLQPHWAAKHFIKFMLVINFQISGPTNIFSLIFAYDNLGNNSVNY